MTYFMMQRQVALRQIISASKKVKKLYRCVKSLRKTKFAATQAEIIAKLLLNKTQFLTKKTILRSTYIELPIARTVVRNATTL